MSACRATDNGYVCNKSADHVGEHAARNQFAFDGPILHRWPNAPAPDHGPLAATLSDRTLDKVLSRPAYVPSSEMKSTRVFGFNVVTISPQGIPGGPRLDGVVSRQRAQDELDELEPFMVNGWKTVMVELREVTS